MRRRHFLLLPLVSFMPRGARAQQSEKVRRIGYLIASDPLEYPQIQEALRLGLREEGYVEGRNIAVVIRAAAGHSERLPALAMELAKEHVEAIVTLTGPAAQAARAATDALPIIFVGVGDPVAAGLVDSLARPGGRITGLALLTPELTGKRLELLKEAQPRLQRVAVLWNPGVGRQMREIEDIESAGPRLGIEVVKIALARAEQLQSAFAMVAAHGAGALVVLASGLHHQHLRQIADLAIVHRVASICEFSEFTGVGGMLVYGPSYPEMMRRAGVYAAKVLKGAAPADMPVEQPAKFKLTVNLRTAGAIAAEIPPAFLARADEVIE